jgi:tetratricopeptide (TPR) repeat protein
MSDSDDRQRTAPPPQGAGTASVTPPATRVDGASSGVGYGAEESPQAPTPPEPMRSHGGAPSSPTAGTVAWSPVSGEATQITRLFPGGGSDSQVPAPTPAPSSIGRPALWEVLAGRFRIVRFIGRGGMGDVYEAEDLELGERVALKTVRSEVVHLGDSAERFRREIQLARRVTHPNVCRIFDLCRHRPEGGDASSELTFFSMELLQGETLEHHLRASGKMLPADALPIVRQVAEGLSAAHRVGVVHRDLKPANIILVRNGADLRAVITDFGLARLHEDAENLTVRGDILGTPSYMAPEQVSGGEVTAATDIYAFGCVLYEMVAGVPPFVGTNAFSVALKRLKEDPAPPHLLAPGLEPAWDAAILRCLEREPADRFAQARDVAAALGGGPPVAAPGRRRRFPRRALGLAAAGVLVLAAVVGGFLWLRRPGKAVLGTGAPLTEMFNSPEEIYGDGVKMLTKLDSSRAEELFRKAIDGRSDYWLAHSGLAVALADLGHEDRAAEESKKALDHLASLSPEERLVVAARAQQVAGQWKQAVPNFEALHRLAPNNVDYSLGLIRALASGGRAAEALTTVQAVRQSLAATSGTTAAARIDLAEAEVAKSLADFPREAEAARRSRLQSERDGDGLLAARAMCLEAGAAAHQGNRQEALVAFKKAEAIYAGAADQRNLAQVLWGTAGVLYYQGDLQQASEKAKEAVDIFKDIGDLRGQSRALDTLASIEGSQGNVAGARTRYQAAVENYHRLGDKPLEAQATNNLALSLKQEGKLDEAATRFAQALTLYQELGDRSGQASALYFLASVSFNQLDLPKADAYLAQSSKEANAINDETRIVDGLGLAADVAAARGDFAAVRDKRQEALTRGRTRSDKNIIAESQIALAQLELDKQHTSSAQAYAQEALNHYQSEHMADEQAEAESLMACILLAQHASGEAAAAVARAEKLAATSHEPEVGIVATLAKSRIIGAGNPEAARHLLEAALAKARAAGLGPLTLDVRLALGKLDMAHGDTRRGAELLAALEKEARGRGFIAVADQAQNASRSAASSAPGR